MVGYQPVALKTLALLEPLGDGVSRVLSTGIWTSGHVILPVIFANYNIPPDSAVNDLLLGGEQYEVGETPSSLMPIVTSGVSVTRDADVASFNISGTALDTTGALSYYFDLIKQRDGLIFYHGNSAGTAHIGNYYHLVEYIHLHIIMELRQLHHLASASTTYGDRVQLLAIRNIDGSVQLFQSLNGTGVIAASTSAVNTTTSMTATLTISDAVTLGSVWDTRNVIKCCAGRIFI